MLPYLYQYVVGGAVFKIGCFGSAVGCTARGTSEAYWSWFPGYSWRIEVCSGCAEHLGWLFTSTDHDFHGLILDRLTEIEERSEG